MMIESLPVKLVQICISFYYLYK